MILKHIMHFFRLSRRLSINIIFCIINPLLLFLLQLLRFRRVFRALMSFLLMVVKNARYYIMNLILNFSMHFRVLFRLVSIKMTWVIRTWTWASTSFLLFLLMMFFFMLMLLIMLLLHLLSMPLPLLLLSHPLQLLLLQPLSLLLLLYLSQLHRYELSVLLNQLIDLVLLLSAQHFFLRVLLLELS